MTDNSNIEVKNIVDDIIKRFKTALNVDGLKITIIGLLQKRYNRGLEEVDSILSPPNKNVLPNEAAIQFLSSYTFSNVKDMSDDSISKLRKELTQALMNRESAAQIKERLHSTLDISKARAATIARTESHRAYNVGKLEAAQQSGLQLTKRWSTPSPECGVCKTLQDKKVPLNEPFKVKKERYFNPPAHPNCKCTLIFEQVES